MRKISVPIALLAVLAVSGTVQSVRAQGGVMVPEHAAAPAVHTVHVVPANLNEIRRESNTAETTRVMPVPSNRPMAKGYLIHVQNNKVPVSNVAVVPPQGGTLAPMSMSGFAPKAAGAVAPSTVMFK